MKLKPRRVLFFQWFPVYCIGAGSGVEFERSDTVSDARHDVIDYIAHHLYSVAATNASQHPHHLLSPITLVDFYSVFSRSIRQKGFTLFSTINLAFLGQFLYFFPLMETGINTLGSHVIYLLNSLMTS